MGSASKMLKNAVRVVAAVSTYGASEALGVGKMIEGKKKSGAGGIENPVRELEDERQDSSKKRKALFATSGNEKGEEVLNVGDTSRGNLFGN